MSFGLIKPTLLRVRGRAEWNHSLWVSDKLPSSSPDLILMNVYHVSSTELWKLRFQFLFLLQNKKKSFHAERKTFFFFFSDRGSIIDALVGCRKWPKAWNAWVLCSPKFKASGSWFRRNFPQQALHLNSFIMSSISTDSLGKLIAKIFLNFSSFSPDFRGKFLFTDGTFN